MEDVATLKVSLLFTEGGVGGVITSCEVQWMMLNPGRCCLVGRCCYVESFVYRRGGGGVGVGVITSCEVGWMMLNPGRCCLVGRCCYVESLVVHTSLVIHGICKMFLFQHGQTSSSSAMKMEVRLIKPFQRKT